MALNEGEEVGVGSVLELPLGGARVELALPLAPPPPAEVRLPAEAEVELPAEVRLLCEEDNEADGLALEDAIEDPVESRFEDASELVRLDKLAERLDKLDLTDDEDKLIELFVPFAWLNEAPMT